MESIEIIKEFWGVILVFTILLIAGIFFIFFIFKNGLKGLVFIGQQVDEIGVIDGGIDRPKDSITVYKLKDDKTGKISWCLNIITKSRKFHGAGRISGEIPLNLSHSEMSALITTFKKYRDS